MGVPTGKLRIAALLRPYWKSMVVALLAVVGETITDVLQPWPLKIVVDNVVQSKPLRGWLGRLVSTLFAGDTTATLKFAVAAVALVAILGALSGYVEKYFTTRVGQWIVHDLRQAVYQHLQRLSIAEHSSSRKGELLSRMTSDISSIQDFVSNALLGIFVDVLTLVAMIGIMSYLNWRLTLLSLVTMPALLLVANFFTPRIKRATRAVRKKEGELLSSVTEVLSAIQVVQAYGQEDYENRRFAAESREHVEAGLQARTTKATLSPLVDIIVACGTCLVLWFGAKLALAGSLTAGDLVVFLSYLKNMYKPMRDLSKMNDALSKASIGYERVQELLGTESRVRDRPDARQAPVFKGRIEFDHVTFAFDGGKPILSDVTLTIEAGQVVAFVGPSGAGKTSIVNLIPRFHEPQSGQVRIDNRDIREYTLKSLRDQISFVLQDTNLFRATVWENLAYGKPDAAIEDTILAAQMANAHDFILEMPQGYATMVGERGVTLSGGQRQRIAIARAIVRNTPILILDEATSGLDAVSERTVTEALDRLMKGRTSVIIAHHLDTIRHADVIFVVKDAEIVERGSHNDLVAAGGVYTELYRAQTAQRVSV